MGSSPDCSAAVVTAFRSHFGCSPDRAAHAPGRVNLIGEHTDHNAGLCLPFALSRRTHAAVAERSDDVVRIHSMQTRTTVTHSLASARSSSGWAAYVVGTISALRCDRGFDVLIDSDVPIGAGLSSSAALTCAVAMAVAPGLTRAELLVAAMRAENDYVGAPTGGLDQTVALQARPGQALLLDFARPAEDRLVRSVPTELTDHEWWVIDTGVAHDLADGGYARRRTECADAARALGVEALSEAAPEAIAALAAHEPLLAARARHVITENERVRRAVRALDEDDAAAMGAALTASHLSLRDEFAVSCAELDETVEALLAQGARGARMVGGGFGGSALALLPVDRVTEALSAVAALFRLRGWQLPVPIAAGSGGSGAALCR